MDVSTIEIHYLENRHKLLKKLSFRAGTPEDAEDVLQEAYYRALKYYKSYDGIHFGQWFNTIMNNTLKEHKNIQKGNSTDEFLEEEADGTGCPHYANHIMKEVFELISTKSLVQQEVLMLFFRHEYSAVDISRVTDYSYAQCHKIISRFKEELKQLYQ